MRPGDIVYFWQAGERETRGIYGWGRITSAPFMEGDSNVVEVRYEHKLSKHINVNTIESHGRLSNLMILRLAIGTNFLINRSEGEAIAQLMPSDARPEVHND